MSAPNKEMKLTKLGQIGASQLISGVGPTRRGHGEAFEKLPTWLS